MGITLTVVFEDGREERVSEHDHLSDAIEHALALVEWHGADPGDGSAPPQLIRVVRNGRIELAISVIRGGLANPVADAKRTAGS